MNREENSVKWNQLLVEQEKLAEQWNVLLSKQGITPQEVLSPQFDKLREQFDALLPQFDQLREEDNVLLTVLVGSAGEN